MHVEEVGTLTHLTVSGLDEALCHVYIHQYVI